MAVDDALEYGLGDVYKQHIIGGFDQGQAQFVCGLAHNLRCVLKVLPDGEDYAGKSLLDQSGNQSFLAFRIVLKAKASRQEQHTAPPPLKIRIGNIDDVYPADAIAQP